MRYRILSPTGDYVFGQGRSKFLVNSPDAVGQAAKTRLRLLTGEWFLDQEEGTPYATQILGTNTQSLYDRAIQERVLGTEGVVAIQDYASSLNNRDLTVSITIDTIYGQTTIQQVVPL
jgi:hypothetical protein